MKRARVGFALILAWILAGCGSSPSTGSKSPDKEKTPATVAYFQVDPATAASVHGKITLKGSKPSRKLINMDEEKGCADAHAGKPVYDEPVVTGKAGGLANVFVYVKTGLEGKKFEPPKTAVVLDQNGCMFVPRVVGIQSGQNLAVKNSDNVSHNVHPMPTENREWNQQQSPGTPDLERRFARPEVMIPVRCNVHKWMKSYIGVMDHPYFAVTGPDGSFDFKNLPPGDYTIAVWHEQLGGQTQELHVGALQNAEVAFSLN